MKALLGKAVLAVWNDIAADLEDEYNDWYTNQHLPERVGVEGFLRGRRFRRVADSGGPQYFTLYEVADLDVLTSDAYMAALNTPTDWTKKIAPQFQNSTRTACRVTASVGQGTGGCVTTIQLTPSADEADQLRKQIVDEWLPALVERPDIVAAHLCEADLGVTSAKESTAEQAAMRDRGSATVAWFVMLEGAGREEPRPDSVPGRAAADPSSFRLVASLAD